MVRTTIVFLRIATCLYCVVMYSCHADPCAVLTQEGPSRHTCSPSLTSLCVCVCVCVYRGVGTTAAGTAMAVPLFHKKSIIQKTGCYSCCEVRLRSAKQDTHEQMPVRARVYNVYVYVYAHARSRLPSTPSVNKQTVQLLLVRHDGQGRNASCG